MNLSFSRKRESSRRASASHMAHARAIARSWIPAFAGITIIFILIPFLVNAAPIHTTSFSQWLEALKLEAIAAGVKPETAAILDDAEINERVIELDQKQPEHTVLFDDYSRRIVSDKRVEEGRRLRKENQALLNKIYDRYGVPPHVVIAIWGMESRFGANSGDFKIIDSLFTLAYEGRRADFFRKELINALKILDQEKITADELIGSWAGAMGQCQFMPSTYLRYAVDYHNKGQHDIWTDEADVFASIANYLAAEGWDRDLTWGREVVLTKPLAESDVGLTRKYLLSEWAKRGIRSLDGDPLPTKPLQASLVQPDGPSGRSFLVYDNYRALMRWNRSTYFATTVGLLADRIR